MYLESCLLYYEKKKRTNDSSSMNDVMLLDLF